MDWELIANRNGHIACTQGGESLAGLVQAKDQGIIESKDTAILDSTAHALKFSGFQDMYFQNSFTADYEISPDEALINSPLLINPSDLKNIPASGRPLKGEEFNIFVKRVSEEIADILSLKKIGPKNKTD